jgi:hypothetical protein
MRRAYVDTCLFIYWVERAGPVADAAVRWLETHPGAAMCVALHLATALYHGCTEFWTNDDRLRTAAGPLAANVVGAAV